jgi:two-component system CheB/CheR fusion protein
MTGLQATQEIRKRLNNNIPVIILTGDITTQAMRLITEEQCIHLKKPVKLGELNQSIAQCLKPKSSLPKPPKDAALKGNSTRSVIYIIDDDAAIRDGFAELLATEQNDIETFEDGESFWAAFDPTRESCLLIDAYLPGINGIDLLYRLRDAGHKQPAIMITGHSDVAMAVDAMKAGVTDFLEKPVRPDDLRLAVERAMSKAHDSLEKRQWENNAKTALKCLTPRQREIMERVLRGEPSKNIAADLNISQRTVENHRAAIMSRTGAKSLPALARLALAAKN